jgi:hypothetical protein
MTKQTIYKLGFLKLGQYLQGHTSNRCYKEQPDNIVHKNFETRSMH